MSTSEAKFDSLTDQDLRNLCSAQNLSTDGGRSQLISRIAEFHGLTLKTTKAASAADVLGKVFTKFLSLKADFFLCVKFFTFRLFSDELWMN